MALSSAVERRASLENPSTSLSNPAAWLSEWFGGGKTKSGATVNASNTLSISGVWAAVRLIANAVAMTPLITYQRIDRGKDRAPDHPAYRLLHDRPNPEMTPFTFKQTVQAHAIMWGGGYAEIERNNAGLPIGLWPLLPDRTWAERKDGRKVYKVRVEEGRYEYLAADRVMHIPGLSFDGVLGYNLVNIARESLGLAKAVEEDAARFFGHGARVSGVLSTDGSLNDKQRANIKESWDRMHSGLSNAHRTALLEAGLKWQQVGISPEEAQNLQTRQFSVSEIARWVGVPPHMIGDLSRSTNNNIEEQGLEFLRYALNWWLVQWEQTVSHDLFAEEDRSGMFSEFLRESLLAMDSVKQGQFFRELFQTASISPNEIRGKLNMNPYEGGDVYMLPLNMASADVHADVLTPNPGAEPRAFAIVGPDAKRWATNTEPPVEAAAVEAPVFSLAKYRERRSVDARRRIVTIYEPLLQDAADVFFTKEINAGTRALDKAFRNRGVSDFEAWVDEFYRTHPEFITGRSRRLILAMAESIQAEIAEEMAGEPGLTEEMREFADAYTDGMAEREVGRSMNQLREILRDTPPEDVETALRSRFEEWREKRAAKFARRNAAQASNALARETYMELGVERLVWVTDGDACKLCNRMSGKTTDIRSAFLAKGETVDPEDGETAPLTTTHLVRHPPLHDGCSCGVSPAVG